MVNSKQKGKRGEREFAQFLTDHGFPARRTQQYKGTADSADVECEDAGYLHIEVKTGKVIRLYEAIAQAKSDSEGTTKLPIVAHKRDRGEWLVTMPAQALISLMESMRILEHPKQHNQSKDGKNGHVSNGVLKGSN